MDGEGRMRSGESGETLKSQVYSTGKLCSKSNKEWLNPSINYSVECFRVFLGYHHIENIST